VSRRPAYGLLTAEAVSITGTRMSVIAVPWFVLQTTGSALLTGVAAAVEMGALVSTKILGGPLVDRLGFRVASAGGDLVAGLALGLVPLLHVLGLLTFPLLLVLVGVTGLFRGPSDNAKYAAVPDVAAAAGWSNERGAGLADSVHRFGTFVGAPAGGLLVAAIGAPAVIAIDALTFLVSAAIVAVFVRLPARTATDPDTGTADPEDAAPSGSTVRRYLGELADGFRFVRRDPLLLAIVAMVTLTNLLDQALFAVLMPVWADERFGSAAPLGIIAGTFGAGALVGSLLMSAYGERLPRRRAYAWAFLLGAVPRIFVLVAPVGLWGIVVVSVLGGVLVGAINPLLGAAEFERAPAEMRARVLGAVGGLAWAGIPLGGLVGGWLATWLGATTGIVVIGVLYLLVTLDPFVRRRTWALMDRQPAASPAAEPAPVR
jgi:MFS family permease